MPTHYSKKLIDFKSLQIKLASSDDIENWSFGEVTKPETINYRTLKPEKDGLFCEKIFGPTKDWECYCGKYKRIRYRGIVCDKCGVEVTQSKVRRERMGHITLAYPVAHVWYFKGAPSKLSLLLDISPRNLDAVIYFAKYVVLSVDAAAKKAAQKRLQSDLNTQKAQLAGKVEKEISLIEKQAKKDKTAAAKKYKNKEQRDLVLGELDHRIRQQITALRDKQLSEEKVIEEIYTTLASLIRQVKIGGLLTEDEYHKLDEYGYADFIEVNMGSEAILELIKHIDLDKLSAQIKKEVDEFTGQKRIKSIKRLKVVEGFRRAGINPAWMILTKLPVLPPDLRPMVQLSGGRFATSDINDLYRRVINRNNRLKHLIQLGAPEIILRNEKRMLQESVDSLIDTSQRSSNTRVRSRRKELRSLSDMLRGKQGRFRQNLLGKRVDYSGRSVIVVGPELKLNQCGLPKDMALEMFKPFVLRELIIQGLAPNVRSAKHVLENRPPEVFDILEQITKNHPVLLNRAPTLHKLGIQAFYPVLTEGSAIRLHPCVCAGFNADFDGDQMAVHIPLSEKSQQESIELMMPGSNLLKPADGSPITLPNKEMAFGCYYLTSFDPTHRLNEQLIFADPKEAITAYQRRQIDVRWPVKVRLGSRIVETSVGRLMFNELIPKDLKYINQAIDSSEIKSIIVRALKLFDQDRVVKLIDDLKAFGFKGATYSGISISLFDNIMIKEKDELIEKANQRVAEVEENYRSGLITAEEKSRLSNEIWMETTDDIATKTWASFAPTNSVRIIIESGGSRATKDQVKQLSAMRGLLVDPLGKIVELPTKSNFREGLSVFEYVTSSRGSRKGLTDSAIKTADAGYLTRRLVDVAHDVIVRQDDCGTKEGLEIKREPGSDKARFQARISGRVIARGFTCRYQGKKRSFRRGGLINDDTARLIAETDIASIWVRSPMICQARYGVCAQCYGWDFSTKQLVDVGSPVGVVAAQSIGEPGTQLTMRVRHFGGIVIQDVTQGLPRVEELFEMRTPKGQAPVAPVDGRVKLEVTETGTVVTLKPGPKNDDRDPIEYKFPKTTKVTVADGDKILAGTPLADGPVDVKEILKYRGLLAAQEYLIDAVQAVYKSQGIPIHDKHFEVIAKKMSDWVFVETQGNTSMLPGDLVDKARFIAENEEVLAEGGSPATGQIRVMGITRASLYTYSWLSAASFQETTNVLSNAAVQGLEDNLLGLKESVIIGRLIPTTKERAAISS